MANNIAHFHLPGLFEFYPLYKVFIPLFYQHREYFYPWCDIASIYGSPYDCLWGGGRTGYPSDYDDNPKKIIDFVNNYNIQARLTFSNSLLKNEHLSDTKCNKLCSLLNKDTNIKNGVIIYSDLLLDYIKSKYPSLYFVSSTTKVITDFNAFLEEVNRPEFSYVVLDFRLNKDFDKLCSLSPFQKDKVEFLCNECCFIGCKDRSICYQSVSKKNLGIICDDHICKAPNGNQGYKFSTAMKNPSFIGIDHIKDTYIPMGFSNFKIEGRGLGSAMILEFLLYYLTKPEYQINVREHIYLDSMLDIF